MTSSFSKIETVAIGDELLVGDVVLHPPERHEEQVVAVVQETVVAEINLPTGGSGGEDRVDPCDSHGGGTPTYPQFFFCWLLNL